MTEADKRAKHLLMTTRGQVDGIIQMIDNCRYSVDISIQILAVCSLLKKANFLLTKQHMDNCLEMAYAEGEDCEGLKQLTGVILKMMDN